jgi:hypothetical protein
MTSYSVTFKNTTGSVWTLVVTAALPNGGGGLESVAFQQTRAAPGGQGTIRFNDQLCVCVATSSGEGGTRVYETTLANPATNGSAWKVIADSGVQQFEAAGAARFTNEIDVRNASDALANAGLGLAMTGAVFQANVPIGAFVPFILPLAFQALISSAQVAPGQVMSVSSDTMSRAMVLTEPVPLTLSANTPAATVTASMDGATVELTVTYP